MENTDKNNLKFEIYQELGECYTQTGDLEKAIKHYEEAQKIDPQHDRPFVGLGIAVMQKNDYERAKGYFYRALELNPNSDKAMTGLAMILCSTERSQEGFEMYQQALNLDPADLTALSGLIRCAYAFDRLDIAEHYLNDYLEIYPGNIKILFCLAGTYFKRNKIKKAKDIIEKIFIFDPDHREARELFEKIEGSEHAGTYEKCENL